jgi:hypothetical protein
MTHPVVSGNTDFSRLWAVIRSVIPAPVRDFWVGPVDYVDIDLAGGRMARPLRLFRPVTLRLAPDLILESRMTLPPAARADVATAAEIMVRTQTPFAPGELLVHASLATATPVEQDLVYDVRLTPRSRIDEVLTNLKIRVGRVEKITPINAPDVDFIGAFRSRRTWFYLSRILPVVGVIAALACLGLVRVETLRAQRMAVDAALVSEVAAVTSLSAELSERERALGAQAAVGGLFQGLPSAFLLLERFRSVLTPSITLSRIRLDDGQARLDVQAPDILAEIRTLSAAMPEYRATLDGSLGRTPDGRMEIGTVLLTPGAP